MPLIKEGVSVADPFLHIADGEPLPAEGAIIISLARWQEERGLIEPHRDPQGGRPLGVRLKAADFVEQIAGDLDRLAVIALEFPKFNDGRAMSQARLLRERYGYRGEIRATGKVTRDLLLFMHRCGFDAFETGDHVTAEIVRKSLATFSFSYQPAADGRPSVIELRHRQSRPVPPAAKESGAAGPDRCSSQC
jgi:uncharacterized protein (DUF934 family)